MPPRGKNGPRTAPKAAAKSAARGKRNQGKQGGQRQQKAKGKANTQRRPIGQMSVNLFSLRRIGVTPIPTLFADGKWSQMSSTVSVPISCPVQATGVRIRRVLAVCNGGSSSNIILDFGECNQATTTSGTYLTYSPSVFPATIASGLTSAKSGRNGAELVLTTPGGLSAGQIYIIRSHERQYMANTSPSQANIYAISESLIARHSAVPLNGAALVNPKHFFNIPRSALTYSEFGSYFGALTAADHMGVFSSLSIATMYPFPMTVTWVICEGVTIPTTNTTAMPAGFTLKAHLELGTRWDADHPMANSETTHKTVDHAAFNAATTTPTP